MHHVFHGNFSLEVMLCKRGHYRSVLLTWPNLHKSFPFSSTSFFFHIFVHIQHQHLTQLSHLRSSRLLTIDLDHLTILNKYFAFINQRVKHVLLQSWFHGKSLMAHLRNVLCLCWLLQLEPDVRNKGSKHTKTIIYCI